MLTFGNKMGAGVSGFGYFGASVPFLNHISSFFRLLRPVMNP